MQTIDRADRYIATWSAYIVLLDTRQTFATASICRLDPADEDVAFDGLRAQCKSRQ